MQQQNMLLYELEAKPPAAANLLYGLQWAVFIFSTNIFYLLVIGNVFRLSPIETTALIQRSIFLVGLGSLLQALWGHRLPLIEGVAALWFSIFILFAQIMEALGQRTVEVLPYLQFGLIFAGVFLLFLSTGGVLDWLQRLFTPLVTGSTLILLALQVSGTFVKGMLGYQNGRINGLVALISIGIASLVTLLSYKGNKWLKSISALIGMAVGWGLFHILGVSPEVEKAFLAGRMLYFPRFFDWGFPKFSSGVAIAALVTSLVIISNQVASITAVKESLSIDLPGNVGKRSGIINGLAHILAGCFASIGTIPYAVSAGFIGLTGVGARIPFIVATVILMLAGLIWPLGQFFALMPAPVAYAVSFTTFSQMISLGLLNFTRVEMSQRNLLIIGLTLLTGVGLMFVPPTAYASLPVALQNVLSNGLLIGIMLTLVLEHVIFRNNH